MMDEELEGDLTTYFLILGGKLRFNEKATRLIENEIRRNGLKDATREDLFKLFIKIQLEARKMYANIYN
jgi:hypothetical protein